MRKPPPGARCSPSLNHPHHRHGKSRRRQAHPRFGSAALSHINVICRGRRCPVRAIRRVAVRTRANARAVTTRLWSAQGFSLRRGVTLQFRVSADGEVGAYTRFTVPPRAARCASTLAFYPDREAPHHMSVLRRAVCLPGLAVLVMLSGVRPPREHRPRSCSRGFQQSAELGEPVGLRSHRCPRTCMQPHPLLVDLQGDRVLPRRGPGRDHDLHDRGTPSRGAAAGRRRGRLVERRRTAGARRRAARNHASRSGRAHRRRIRPGRAPRCVRSPWRRLPAR